MVYTPYFATNLSWDGWHAVDGDISRGATNQIYQRSTPWPLLNERSVRAIRQTHLLTQLECVNNQPGLICKPSARLLQLKPPPSLWVDGRQQRRPIEP